jgi:hypothetical protein
MSHHPKERTGMDRRYVSAAELRRMAINEDHAGHDDRELAFRTWQETHAIQDAAVPLFVEACGMPALTRA